MGKNVKIGERKPSLQPSLLSGQEEPPPRVGRGGSWAENYGQNMHLLHLYSWGQESKGSAGSLLTQCKPRFVRKNHEAELVIKPENHSVPKKCQIWQILNQSHHTKLKPELPNKPTKWEA